MMKVTVPHRVSRSYTQTLCRGPDEVFPLLCPVRECDWVNGWDPKLVLSESGLAEKGCVFVTPGVPQDAVWVITVHDAANHHLEIIKFIPDMVVGTISILLEEEPEVGTKAHITYSYTALSQRGRMAIDEFSEAHFDSFMRTWENELNHFLLRGKKLQLEDEN